MLWRASHLFGLHHCVLRPRDRRNSAAHGYFELIWQASCSGLHPFGVQAMRAARTQTPLVSKRPMGDYDCTTCREGSFVIRRRLFKLLGCCMRFIKVAGTRRFSIWRAFARALCRGNGFSVLEEISPSLARCCNVVAQ